MNKKLKYNKYPNRIDASLDLHGYTLDEAEVALRQFLTQAKSQNYRQIRVITGKGINSPDGRARLKPWLEGYLRAMGYSFMSAKVNEGGEGATDIKL
jgi:DNA-nicking Smr family endonuclease